jgi:peptidyl-prolyl cis-trans isomerase D
LTDAQAALENAAEDADKDALQSAVTEAEQAVAAAQAAYDEAAATTKANAKAKADEVYALAAAEGADFDALVTEYSTDSMPAEGYAIREGFASFVTEFTEGAMALQNVGDVSEPVESTYGYHIIQYASDVEEGAVALEDVQSVISSSLLSQKQNETSAATLAQWVSEANVKTYADRLN